MISVREYSVKAGNREDWEDWEDGEDWENWENWEGWEDPVKRYPSPCRSPSSASASPRRNVDVVPSPIKQAHRRRQRT